MWFNIVIASLVINSYKSKIPPIYQKIDVRIDGNKIEKKTDEITYLGQLIFLNDRTQKDVVLVVEVSIKRSVSTLLLLYEPNI